MAKRNRAEYNKYQREYHLRLYHKRRTEVLHRLGGKCAKCDETSGLQLDHIDPSEKKLDISAAVLSVSKERFEAELKKCQLLCFKHHNEKSILERGLRVAKGEHGTISSYRYCHCDICKAAKRAYINAYRARKRATIKR